MLSRNVVVGSINPALQDREVTLRSVSICVAAYILFDGMIDGFVAGEAGTKASIDRAAVGAEMCILGDRFDEEWL
jgi:hypothetical protein